jgi:hypothetical protein
MLSFIKYLIEATSMDDELLGHLTHTKDIPHEAPSHVHTAIDLIRQFHHLRQGHSITVSASLKHDGGASVHIIHDKDGRVGVTDKHRLDRGIVAYSDEDVDKHFGKHPDYAAALKNLRNHGHEVVTRGHHVQGDILWSHGDSSKREGNKVSYTPNRITYHAKSSAPIGIAIHTEVKNGVAQALSKKATKSSKNIFVPREDFNPSEHEYSSKDKKAVEHHLSQAEKLAENHTTVHLTPEHIEHLTIYHNRVARGHRKPTVEGYATYLRSRGATEAEKKKSSAGQQKVRDKFESMAKHVEANSDHFHRSIQIRQHLQAATDHALNGIEHPDLQTTVDDKKSKGEGVVLRRKDNLGRVRPVAKLVHSDIQYALGNNPRFPTKGAINESTQSTTVLSVGKIRYATPGHAKMIRHAKKIADKLGADLHIHLTGTSEPLTPEQKIQHAQAMFGHPVESTKNVFDSLQRLTGKHHSLHIVAGSDRADEYRRLPSKYVDKSGKEIYNFPGGIHVHEVPGKRVSIADIGKHPSKMNRDELEKSSSATEVIGLAKKGDYEGFKAYHPGVSEKIVKSNYDTIRSQSMKEEKDPMIVFRKFIDAKRLVPSRSGSKGGDGGGGNGGGNGNGN